LQKEPAPLASHAFEVPAELARIVTRALTKDRNARYQTMKDMLIDLSNLKRKLEVDSVLEHTVSPELRGRELISNEELTQATDSVALGATTQDDGDPQLSSTVSTSGGRSLRRMAVAALFVVAAATAWFYWLIIRRPRENALVPCRSAK
jgi:hypothetical protein